MGGLPRRAPRFGVSERGGKEEEKKERKKKKKRNAGRKLRT